MTDESESTEIELARERTERSRDRTHWSEDRTLLANQRTFASGLRTGMAALAVALGLQALFASFQPTWAAKAVASLFVLTAIMIFAVSTLQARAVQHRLKDHDAKPQTTRRIEFLGALLIAGSLATGVILWLL